jgi:hypothetical protein
MFKLAKSTVLSAALLAAVAGGAFAQQATYSSAHVGPKPSGGSNTQTTHFQKPTGYDQNPIMHPYTRPDALKPQ